LKRTIQRLVENPLARALLQGEFKPGTKVIGDADAMGGVLVFSSGGATVVTDASQRRDARGRGERELVRTGAGAGAGGTGGTGGPEVDPVVDAVVDRIWTPNKAEKGPKRVN
jgi:hypothetical protein